MQMSKCSVSKTVQLVGLESSPGLGKAWGLILAPRLYV